MAYDHNTQAQTLAALATADATLANAISAATGCFPGDMKHVTRLLKRADATLAEAHAALRRSSFSYAMTHRLPHPAFGSTDAAKDI